MSAQPAAHGLGLVPGTVTSALLKQVTLVSPKAILPKFVDLRPLYPPVYDQGALGSCVANASCGCIQILQPSFLGSRMFLWYQTRLMEKTQTQNVGCYIHDAVTVLETLGIPAEVDYTYDAVVANGKFAVAPPASVYPLALKHLAVQTYNLPNDPQQQKGALSLGFPWMTGIALYTNLEPPTAGNFAIHGGYVNGVLVKGTGIISMPGPKDTIFGYHAVCIVGYDDDKHWWIVRNSWGTQFGDNGYYYLPYELMVMCYAMSDNWMIQTMTTGTSTGTTTGTTKGTNATTNNNTTSNSQATNSDCTVSDFSASGVCSATACGTTGTQSTVRTVLNPAVGTGAACPVLTGTQACKAPACAAVDCAVGAWAPYPGCLATDCGQQAPTQTTTRSIITPASNGGADCPTLTQSRTCPTPCRSTKGVLIAAGVGLGLLIPVTVLAFAMAL